MTTKLEQAARQALEALEYETSSHKSYNRKPLLSSLEAITALREALAEPNIEEMTLTQIAARHEQAEQEPVAIGSEWKPCMKLPVVVHVREQREGESHVSTREGITPVRPDDLIMRGIAGEEYPIGRELFNRTYTFDTAAPVRTKDHFRDATEKVAEQRSNSERMEPVAWAYIDSDGSFMDALDRQHGAYQTPLYMEPCVAFAGWDPGFSENVHVGYEQPVVQEPFVDSVEELGEAAYRLAMSYKCFYISREKYMKQFSELLKGVAPIRTKDLTDDEIETIFEYWYSQPETEVWSTVDLARAVIAADRKLNGVEK